MSSSSPPLVLSSTTPTTIDLLNGYSYTLPSSSSPSSARLAIYDPQHLLPPLSPHLLPLFPLSSLVVRSKTGQATIATVDVSLVAINTTTSSSPSTPSVTAASLRSSASWHWLPYLHVYLLSTSSYPGYVRQHRLSITPFVAAFTDPPPPPSSSPPSSSPASADRLGLDCLILFLQHAEERKEAKGERKVLDKLRSDWGKDAVVSAVMPDEWWSGVTVDEGPVLADTAASVSLSSLSFFSSPSSTSSSSGPMSPPSLAASLLPVLKTRLLASFAVRCDAYHGLLHSLLLLSSYPHWPFARFLLAQLSYIHTQSQFALYAECTRMHDELKAVMEAASIRAMMRDGIAAPPTLYVYDQGEGEEEQRLWRGDMSMMEAERFVHARLCETLRKQGKVESVIERGEALMHRWMETEVPLADGWSVWPWLLGCAVDVWSRGEREMRERAELERKAKVGEEKAREASDDVSTRTVDIGLPSRKERGSSFLRVLSPERRRREGQLEAERTRAHSLEAARKAQEDRVADPRKKKERRKPSTPPHPRRKDGPHALTAQLRALRSARTTFLFAVINRVLAERRRRWRDASGSAGGDVLEDEGSGAGEGRRRELEREGQERRMRMEEWRKAHGEEFVLVLDEEVSTEEMYRTRQEKIDFALAHPALFPVLLHSLLSFAAVYAAAPSTSPSLHSDHFLALHARLFSALSLSPYASALFLHLASLHHHTRWHSLAAHFLLLRLREELTARRFTFAAHTLGLLLAARQERWLDIKMKDVAIRLDGWTTDATPSARPHQTGRWPCCEDGVELPSSSGATAALLRHVCEAHIQGAVGESDEESSLPAFHLFRELVPSPTAPLSLPLPRPSIPSPPALMSLLLSSRSLAPVSGVVAGPSVSSSNVVGPVLVASLTAFFTFTAFTIRLFPYDHPFVLRMDVECTSLLPTVRLDDVAFTLRVERDGEVVEIDVEYHDVVLTESAQSLTFHAALVDTSNPPSPTSSSLSHPPQQSCNLRLDPDDYAQLLSMLSTPSPSSSTSAAVVELVHVWVRFARLHLLWWEKAPLLRVLSIVIDSTVPKRGSAASSSFPPSSPSSAVTLSALPSARPFLLGGDAEALLVIRGARELKDVHLTVGSATVKEAFGVLAHEDGRREELTFEVNDGRAFIERVLPGSSLFLSVLLTPALPQSFSTSTTLPLRSRLISGGSTSGTALAEADVTLVGLPPFAVSSSVVHLGHRLFVSLTVRCLLPRALYHMDEARVQWGSRWSTVSAAEEEVRGVTVEGPGELQLMYQVEDTGQVDAGTAQDGVVHLRAVVTSSATASTSVSASYPLSFPQSALLPPDLHVIIAAPSSTSLGAMFALSVTVLLSSTTRLSLPLPLLCSLHPSPNASFFFVGATSTSFVLSSSSASHTLSALLMPIAAGLVPLPDIRLYWKSTAAAAMVEGSEGLGGGGVEWVEVDERRVKRHFGHECVQVQARGLTHCDMRRVQTPSTLTNDAPAAHDGTKPPATA